MMILSMMLLMMDDGTSIILFLNEDFYSDLNYWVLGAPLFLTGTVPYDTVIYVHSYILSFYSIII